MTEFRHGSYLYGLGEGLGGGWCFAGWNEVGVVHTQLVIGGILGDGGRGDGYGDGKIVRWVTCEGWSLFTSWNHSIFYD